MSLGNTEIQELIELGGSAVKEYKFKSNGIDGVLRWSPIKVIDARIAYFKALQHVTPAAHDYISTAPDERDEVDENKKLIVEKPPTEEFIIFNYFHAVYSIHAALRLQYIGILVEEVEALNISHDDFHEVIAVASGVMEGQETIGKFSDIEGTQEPED